ncbi:MAG: GYD domain-containing protein [Ignavibacteria bacterium]
MPYYLVQVAYTSGAWASMIKNPQNRTEAVRPAVEKLGGKIEGAWFAFGDYDVVAIFNMPDNVNAAAISLAFSAGGAAKSVKTNPLLTIEEAMDAMKKAGGTGYKPPS